MSKKELQRLLEKLCLTQALLEEITNMVREPIKQEPMEPTKK